MVNSGKCKVHFDSALTCFLAVRYVRTRPYGLCILNGSIEEVAKVAAAAAALIVALFNQELVFSCSSQFHSSCPAASWDRQTHAAEARKLDS